MSLEKERTVIIQTNPLGDDDLDSLIRAIQRTQNPLIRDIQEIDVEER